MPIVAPPSFPGTPHVVAASDGSWPSHAGRGGPRRRHGRHGRRTACTRVRPGVRQARGVGARPRAGPPGQHRRGVALPAGPAGRGRRPGRGHPAGRRRAVRARPPAAERWAGAAGRGPVADGGRGARSPGRRGGVPAARPAAHVVRDRDHADRPDPRAGPAASRHPRSRRAVAGHDVAGGPRRRGGGRRVQRRVPAHGPEPPGLRQRRPDGRAPGARAGEPRPLRRRARRRGRLGHRRARWRRRS